MEYKPLRIKKSDWSKLKLLSVVEEKNMIDLIPDMIKAYEEKKAKESKKWLVY